MIDSKAKTEVEQFFFVECSCRGYLTAIRALDKIVRQHCGYQIIGEDTTVYQWNFDSEKRARSAIQRLEAAKIDHVENLKLCKVTRIWAVQVLEGEE